MGNWHIYLQPLGELIGRLGGSNPLGNRPRLFEDIFQLFPFSQPYA